MPENAMKLGESVLAAAAEKAAASLSAWINRPVSLAWKSPGEMAVEEAGGMLGEPDAIVPVCILEVSGPVNGRLILVNDAATIAGFINTLMGMDAGVTADQELQIRDNPTAFWDELARSAALETANIVACAFLNALAASLPADKSHGLMPSPPRFAVDYAGSLAQFLLAEFALRTGRILVIESQMLLDDRLRSDWRLIWIPGEAEASSGLNQ
ncbi:MAG: hypothetical protein ACKO0V_05530 [bacterium]